MVAKTIVDAEFERQTGVIVEGAASIATGEIRWQRRHREGHDQTVLQQEREYLNAGLATGLRFWVDVPVEVAGG